VLDRRGLGDRDDAGGDDSWAAEQRERLEGVCRYALRPPVARATSIMLAGSPVADMRHVQPPK